MDVRILGFTTVVFCSAFAWPVRPSAIDFRGTVIAAKTIVNDRGSPAYGALEAMNLELQEPTPEVNEYLVTEIDMRSGTTKEGSSDRKLQGLVIAGPTASNQFQKILAEANKEPSVYEIASVLVQEEIHARQKQKDNVRHIPASSGYITVAKLDKPTTSTLNLSGPAWPSTNLPAESSNSKQVPIRNVNREHNRGRVQGYATARNGAALTSHTDEVIVYQSVDGQIGSVTSAQTHDGSFELDVPSIAGDLIAEIRGNNGEILARGVRSLDDIAAPLKTVGIVKDLSVDLYPFFDGLNGAVVSAASIGGKNLYVKGARMQLPHIGREIALNPDSMTFQDATISNGSTTLVSAAQTNFWPSIAIQKSGLDFSVRLFSHSLVRALKNLMGESYETKKNRENGLIWGRIVRGNQPVQNAIVSLIGEDEIQPVYFNGYLPDRLSRKTTSSGEFAMLNVKDGEHMMKISTEDESYWPVLVPAELRTVSFAEVNLLAPRNTNFIAFDAFAGTPLSATIQAIGDERTYQINESGESLYLVPSHDGIAFLEAEATSEYQPIRVAVTGAAGEILFPHVKKTWLKQILEVSESETIPANVVGFVQEEDFIVIVSANTPEANLKISYFDSLGITHSDFGPAGGGFVLSGLSNGMHTVTVLSKQSSRIFTQIVYVDSFASQVMRVSGTF